MLNRYQNKKIKVTTQDGAEFTGTADVFPSGYGLHEFDRAEEGIQLDDVIVFKSDIRRIEELPDAASVSPANTAGAERAATAIIAAVIIASLFFILVFLLVQAL